jgi:hypothetical protein
MFLRKGLVGSIYTYPKYQGSTVLLDVPEKNNSRFQSIRHRDPHILHGRFHGFSLYILPHNVADTAHSTQ